MWDRLEREDNQLLGIIYWIVITIIAAIGVAFGGWKFIFPPVAGIPSGFFVFAMIALLFANIHDTMINNGVRLPRWVSNCVLIFCCSLTVIGAMVGYVALAFIVA